jgi:hypothetical protein
MKGGSTRKQRRRLRCAAQMTARARGEETTSESESSRDDDEEEDEGAKEGKITSSPHSLPPEVLPSPGDLFHQQAGISIGTRRTKHPRTDSRGSFSPPPQSGLTLVYSDL